MNHIWTAEMRWNEGKNYKGRARSTSRRYKEGLQMGRAKVGEAVKHHTNQKLCLQIMLLCGHVQWYIS